MDKFELTPEQWEQAQAARAAGSRHVVLQATPEQAAYQQRVIAEEEAAYEDNLNQARELMWQHMDSRVRKLEAALAALLSGHAEDARQLLESKS
jgi:hypothetical protein